MDRNEEIISSIVEVIKAELSPEKIYLFGSRANDNSSDTSDFDIAVSGTRPSNFDPSIFDSIRGLYQIDLVFLQDIDEDFFSIIMNTGVLLYDQTGTRSIS